MDKKLSSNIPEIILNKISELNLKENEYNVYRVAKTGTINFSTFDSTYTEMEKGTIPSENRDLKDIGLYGTSCYLTIGKCKKFLKLQKRFNPAPCIIKGVTKYGLSQKTNERDSSSKDGHIDWWIFEGYENELIKEEIFFIYEEQKK